MCVGGPQDHPENDLLGGPSLSIYLVMVSSSKKIQRSASKGKGPWDKAQERKLPGILSRWSCTGHAIPSALGCDNTREMFPTREAPERLSTQGFYWWLVT
ncbi:unnamed protein product [Pipistrellus nathusii]|uniref:Uncharacterized protein n=1 Tax=Pipistrellus nathusii TaxID=59473 RepID=A0ABP0AJK0_PIPNA